jgi:hypothetical protein
MYAPLFLSAKIKLCSFALPYIYSSIAGNKVPGNYYSTPETRPPHQYETL